MVASTGKNQASFGPNSAFNVVQDPIRLMHYLIRLLNDERVPQSAKIKLFGSGLYTWIDGDIISDTLSFAPGVGYVDDIILVIHGIKCLIAETEAHVAAELWPGDEASFRRVLTAVAWLDKQLYDRIRKGISRLLGHVVGKRPGFSPGEF